MPYVNLQTGNTIYVPDYIWYFKLKDEEIHLFLQECVADDLGVYIDRPFSGTGLKTKLEEDDPIIDEIDKLDPNNFPENSSEI